MLSEENLLHVHLIEYRKLKDEQIARIIMREHMVYVTLGVFGGVSSYALHADQHYAFLVIPWVCLILGWMYVTTDEKVSAIGKYLRHNLADTLQSLVGTDKGIILGWEVAHRSDKYRVSRKIFQLVMDEITFVLSGIFALVAFWWTQPIFDTFFTVIWTIELALLLWLSVLIVVTTDFAKGR